MRKTALVLILAACAPALLFADEVYLKGGAKFTGRIEEQTDTMITIDIGDGVVGVPMARVERVVRKRSALDEYEDRAARVQPNDVEGWLALGRYASQQGLSAQARQAYGNVLVAAPDNAEAREALGFQRVDGRWLAEEDAYQARGYVKYDGEWMTPAEAQSAQAADAAYKAGEEAARDANLAKAEQIQKEAQAARAEEKAREEAEIDTWGQPVYWGGWGYGVSAWPTTAHVSAWPNYRPAQPAQPQQPPRVPK